MRTNPTPAASGALPVDEWRAEFVTWCKRNGLPTHAAWGAPGDYANERTSAAWKAWMSANIRAYQLLPARVEVNADTDLAPETGLQPAATAQLASLTAENERLREALAKLCQHFPTDHDMAEAGWDAYVIKEACDAYDAARAALQIDTSAKD